MRSWQDEDTQHGRGVVRCGNDLRICLREKGGRPSSCGRRSVDEQDRLIVERAKRVLMRYLGLSEPQAHRYIEKHAMDLRVTKIVVARGVLKVYES